MLEVGSSRHGLILPVRPLSVCAWNSRPRQFASASVGPPERLIVSNDCASGHADTWWGLKRVDICVETNHAAIADLGPENHIPRPDPNAATEDGRLVQIGSRILSTVDHAVITKTVAAPRNKIGRVETMERDTNDLTAFDRSSLFS
jgi:hypothetical protein